jgi:hypothetical protein
MRSAIIGASWLWGLVTLPQVTDAAVDFMTDVMLVLTACAIGLAWLVYSCAAPRVFREPRRRRQWLSVPLLGLVSLTLASTDYDLAARVWLCDSELREYTEAARQGRSSRSGEYRRVGLFQVRSGTADEDQVMLETASGFLTSSGIVYRPDGMRPESRAYKGSCDFEHLYGPWWKFYNMMD